MRYYNFMEFKVVEVLGVEEVEEVHGK